MPIQHPENASAVLGILWGEVLWLQEGSWCSKPDQEHSIRAPHRQQLITTTNTSLSKTPYEDTSTAAPRHQQHLTCNILQLHVLLGIAAHIRAIFYV
eukprot:1162058-Pelagomonas_calceolata.AAC.3